MMFIREVDLFVICMFIVFISREREKKQLFLMQKYFLYKTFRKTTSSTLIL